jgi:hypothetical protein
VRARLTAVEQQQQQAPQQQPNVGDGLYIPNADEMSNLVEMFDSVGGAQMMSQVSMSDPDKIDAALALWKAGGDPDVAAAYLYEENVNRILDAAEPEYGQAAPTQLPPEIEALAQRERLNAVVVEATADLSAEQKQAILPHLEEAAKVAAPLIGSAFSDGTPEQQKAAFQTLIQIAGAYSRGSSTVADEGRQQVAQTMRQNAQVLTGSGRPPSTARQSGGVELPRSQEEFEELKASDPTRARRIATALVAREFDRTDTTSVADGLTFGSTP